MRVRGINYDTGFAGGSRTNFEPELVARELGIIADDLHCTAVRVSGADPERLSVAGRLALDAGLELWYAPFPHDLTKAELLPYFAECAARAEQLRQRSPDVVLVLGCELTLFQHGFLPGADFMERIDHAVSSHALVGPTSATLSRQLNELLTEAVEVARSEFGGQVTYASGKWEDVDWTPFDIVSVDLYREQANKKGYPLQLRTYKTHGKPVAVTEFGCCTFRGAADRGGTGWMILDREASPPRIQDGFVRDEAEQAQLLQELLALFEAEDIDSAFWFTFAGYEFPHRDEPSLDLDMASYGVVKMLEGRQGETYPDVPWEPKESFRALARIYAAES